MAKINVIAGIAEAAKIANIAETEIVRLFRTFKIWVFSEKTISFSDKTWLFLSSLMVEKLL